MVTPAQATANVKSATRLLAAGLGFYSGDGSGFDYGKLTADQHIALTNALATYISGHPALFDTGAADLTNPVNSAPLAHNTAQQDTSYSVDEFADAFLNNARAVNPFDPANIATVGKWVLLAVVVLGIAWLFFHRPPRNPAPA